MRILWMFPLALAACDLGDAHDHDQAHELAEAHEHGEAHEDHDHAEAHEEHEHHAHPAVSAEAANRVLVLETKGITRETEALGVVDAHEQMGHHEEALRELREEAAALGADAVIGVEFHHGEAHGQPIHLSGLAVRYRNLRRDQPYDVLGMIDIPADMHHQDEAVREMKLRARDLGADLIINIEYEHGDGSNAQTHLRGTAIRYTPMRVDRAVGMP